MKDRQTNFRRNTSEVIVEDKKEGSRFQNEGEIVLKGDKYKLNLLGTTIYYDGKTMWNHIIDVEEVNITEPTEEEMEFFFSKPSRLFFIYESDFKIKYVGETTENNRTLYDIDLFPSDYYWLLLLVVAHFDYFFLVSLQAASSSRKSGLTSA